MAMTTHRVSRRCYRLYHRRCCRRRRCNATNKRNPIFSSLLLLLCIGLCIFHNYTQSSGLYSKWKRIDCIQYSEERQLLFMTLDDFQWFFFRYWMSVISKWHRPNSNNFGPTINLIIHSCLFNTRPIAKRKWRKKRNVWHGHWIKTMAENEANE